MWYWEEVYHLVCEYIPLSHPPSPIYVCVCVCVCVCVSQIKKILSVVESSYIGKVWYWEGVYHLLRDTNRFGVGMWVYSLISSPFPHICVCVFLKLKKKKLYTCKKQKNSWLILPFSLWLGSLYIANRACLRFNFIHSDSSIRKTVYLLCFFLEREREKEKEWKNLIRVFPILIVICEYRYSYYVILHWSP